MSAKKISEQDVKMGRIYRCSNCETKCDDTYHAQGFKISWGQKTEIEHHYFCCEDCEKYYVREKGRPALESSLAYFSDALPELMEYFQDLLKRGISVPCFFETIRHFKLMKRAIEMLMSQEHTYAEVAVAFHKARDVALELSEELQDEKNKLHKKYFKLEYRAVINDAKTCDELLTRGIQAWF